jgi:hypothetical protein
VGEGSKTRKRAHMKTELSKPSLTKARYNHTRLHSSLRVALI